MQSSDVLPSTVRELRKKLISAGLDCIDIKHSGLRFSTQNIEAVRENSAENQLTSIYHHGEEFHILYFTV